MKPAEYIATERLRDGSSLKIRSLLPSDRAAMLAVFLQASETSRYRRFFAQKRSLSERELDFLVNVDFVGHVALAAVQEHEGRELLVGGGRYVVFQPGKAEVAFAVEESHQSLGIATRVLRHLIVIARHAGLSEFTAEVLSENVPMLSVFERCRLPMTTSIERGVVHVTLDLTGASGQGRT